MRPSTDPNHPSAQAVWLKQKIPAPLLVISIIGLPIILYVFLGGLYDGLYYLAAVTAFCGGGPWLFIYVTNKGSKLAWDEDHVYERTSGWRLHGRFPWIGNFPWRKLAYCDIARIDKIVLNDPSACSFLLPFQLLRMTSHTAKEFTKDDIMFEALAIRDKELAPLLRHIDGKRPGMLPQIVCKQLKKWSDNDR